MNRKTLYLLRHAHAKERLSNQSDFDRELSSVGLQNSTRMGIHLNKEEVIFDAIVSSPARRAITTAQLVGEQMGFNSAAIIQNQDIYEASVRNLLQVINQFKGSWQQVLMVGHNPAITYLSEYISNAETGNMNTCGLIQLEFDDISWEEVTEGSGNFKQYITPDLLNF